ncbi:Aldehyde reductase [Lasiodiplodia theobromae]|uniref:Aldehyde reductase n=1 Tax=Lasiodiplodia theobromae TaxID=45133 RepID=UPI0015C3EF4C|nr:Aldehyde reductase [Lasiodiplodia theobromae]KAF4544811.1 Aldehyde reductase [Lasiodiplodia theobromae]
MPVFDKSIISPGATVLVTGVNGFVGSHVADQLLDYGYRVRGSVRDVQKAAWLAELFEQKYGSGRFELFPVKDMVLEGAFDEAVKGVSGVAHVAAVMTMDADVETVMNTTVTGTLNALKSAAKEPSVKRVVLTSSSVVVRDMGSYVPERPVAVNEYNDGALELVRDMPVSWTDRQKGHVVYTASKVLSEKKAWEWMKEHKPHFGLNTVIPPMILGRSLSVEKQGHPGSSGLPVSVFLGKLAGLEFMSQFYFVNVQDVGLLHVAGLVHPDVDGERMFAYAGTYTFNDWLGLFRKFAPDKTFPDDMPGLDRSFSRIEGRDRSEALLKDLGRSGFTGLEETLRANVEELV